jgi:hypothetical protein
VPHWASLVHLPQAPVVRLQVGAVVEEQGSVVVVPLSPLHATHPSLVASHTGVFPEHAALDVHCTHLPASAPVPHCVERQTIEPSTGVHGPSPFLYPQRLSVSQTPETHARAPSVVVHVPPGTGLPLVTCGWQIPLPERLSHQLPAPHSASVKQALPHAPVAVLQKGPA